MKMSLRTAGFSVAIFLVSIGLRYLALSQTSFANGWDGYFYINQVKALFEEGQMHVADRSLIYPLLAIIQFCVQDYILSFKILCCVLAAAFSVSLFLLSKKWSENEKGALVVASFSLFSPHLTYFASQYPKNLLGVLFFIWLLISLDSRWKPLPFILLILNFFGHRVTAVLSFVALVTHFSRAKAGAQVIKITAVLLILLLAAGLFLPGILNVFDVERLQGIFNAVPQFGPVSFLSSLAPELISTAWRCEIIALSIVFVLSLFYCVYQLRNHQVDQRMIIVLVSLFILVFPFLKWSVDGPAFRFALIFILMCPMLLIWFISHLRSTYGLSIACVVLVASGFLSYRSYLPAKHDPPYPTYESVCRRIASMNDSTRADLIIAHKSLAEYVVYSTGIDAMSWIPEYHVAPEKLWRVAADVKDVQFSFYLSPEDVRFVSRLSPSYTLIREDLWQKFLHAVKSDGNQELLNELSTWRNPDQVRPYFLLKNKR